MHYLPEKWLRFNPVLLFREFDVRTHGPGRRPIGKSKPLMDELSRYWCVEKFGSRHGFRCADGCGRTREGGMSLQADELRGFGQTPTAMELVSVFAG